MASNKDDTNKREEEDGVEAAAGGAKAPGATESGSSGKGSWTRMA